MKIINCSLFPTFLINFFTKGHTRTIKAKKHIALSYIYRGLDIGIGFLLVPLVLGYLDKERYGIWLILFSITTYFKFMDVGLAKGLRNKFAEAKAKGNMDKVRYYVSTTYATVGLISLSFFVLFLVVNPFLEWTKILNTSSGLKKELSILAIFVFGSFSVRYILKTITTILTADQRPSVINLQGLLSRIIKIIILVLLIYTSKGSLLKLGISFSLVPVIVLLILSIFYYTREYNNIKPSLKFVDFSYLKDLMSIGVKFFIISIAGVILFTTDNMIITQLYGPEKVTPYQIAHKYFGMSFMLFMIIVQPLWSAVTDAYSQSDFSWIKNIMKKMRKIWIIFSFGTIVMFIISPIFFKLWVGDKVSIPFLLSISWVVFIIINSYNAIYTNFINGVGKLRIQIMITIFSIIFNISASIFLAKYVGMGISGVITATTISMLLNAILKTIQYNKIINKKATGVWNQ